MTTREWSKIEPSQRDTVAAFLDDEPPVKLGALAKALGLKVKLATMSPGISGEIRPDPEAEAGYIIRVNRHETRERQRFTLAHEIAHFLLHRDYIGEGIADNVLYRSGQSDKIEVEANRLAAELVMPRAKVDARVQEYDYLLSDEEIELLAREFQVSKPAMEIRVGG